MTTPYLRSNPNKMDKSNDFQFTLGSKEFYFQWISWIFQRFPVTLKFEIDKKKSRQIFPAINPYLIILPMISICQCPSDICCVAFLSSINSIFGCYIQISSPPRCSFNDDTRTCANFDAKRGNQTMLPAWMQWHEVKLIICFRREKLVEEG